MESAVLTYDNVRDWIGEEVGVSGWHVVDQDKIDQFAECTGDAQWIHTDPVRARRESPIRTTIAHGFLSLSLVSSLGIEAGVVPQNTQAAFNFGLNAVRFLAPVKSGARIRLRVKLLAVEEKGPGQYLMTAENTMEIEGESVPAMTAETMFMFYERRRRASRRATA